MVVRGVNDPTSIPPLTAGQRVSPLREARVMVTELAALSCIMVLALKGTIEGHMAILGIMAVLMRSLTPFLERPTR